MTLADLRTQWRELAGTSVAALTTPSHVSMSVDAPCVCEHGFESHAVVPKNGGRTGCLVCGCHLFISSARARGTLVVLVPASIFTKDLEDESPAIVDRLGLVDGVEIVGIEWREVRPKIPPPRSRRRTTWFTRGRGVGDD